MVDLPDRILKWLARNDQAVSPVDLVKSFGYELDAMKAAFDELEAEGWIVRVAELDGDPAFALASEMKEASHE